MSGVQTLSQVELDDAYHLAIFHADEKVAAFLRRYFDAKGEDFSRSGISLEWRNAVRNDLINVLLQGLNDCEVEHLGDDRYDALMERLQRRMAEGKPQ